MIDQKSNQRFKFYLTLIATLLTSVVLLLVFMPRETKFGYEYELNRPWKYGTLIAAYDFPIYKTQGEIKAERDSVMKDFMPFYEIDKTMGVLQTKRLREDFYKGQMKGVPAHYLPFLIESLQNAYNSGIISPTDLSKLTDRSVKGIRLIAGNEAITQKLGEVFSTRSAYEYIMHADTVKYQRDMLARCNINNYLTPNLHYDSAKTRGMRQDLLQSVSTASGMVQSGQKIIDRGEIISAGQYKILQSIEKESLKRATPNQGIWLMVLGQATCVVLLIALFVAYMFMYRKEYLHSPNYLLLLFLLMTVFPVAASLFVSHNFISVYLIPFTLVPIFIRIFLDSRTAFVTHVTMILITSLSLHYPYEFILVELVAGLAAIYTLRELTQRSQLFKVAVSATSAALIFGLAYDFVQGITLDTINPSWYAIVAVSGVFLLFAYPLMYLIERGFGFTSSVALVEMSSINNPILRKMSKVAQGTFNHSMQVANLAAEVANKINANAQLVRTGALYHDIGKMVNPAFFTENQKGVNPHNSLSEERSAQIIIGHVKEGLRLAEKYHLPKVIRDFIATHQGKGKVKYFYIQYCNNHPGEKPDEALFTYPGPNPFTREQAILMMCDAVEATSRSLKEVTDESVRELVNRIIDSQVAEGFFKECPITFKDISDTKRVLIDSLKTIYHTRIAYPTLKEDARPEAASNGNKGTNDNNPRPFFGSKRRFFSN